ncbi:MAG: hypothetical protein R3194_14365, partial [Limnobacter sp.]|nr:hypothetical protein [Limnobacter sp.]
EGHFLTSTSGIFQVNQLTGFGFVAQGTGARKGELVLATRGTNFETNKFDLATDANIGYGIGPGGHVVHRGFLKTFKGYQRQLVEMIGSVRSSGITTIHCMGHSLGGALANLNAALLKNAGLNVHLYTIGAPRVGMFGFAHDLTRDIPAKQIHRVSNMNDPVPMVPVFPFFHASKHPSEYVVSKGDKIDMAQHAMADGYACLKQANAWSDLCVPAAHDLMQAGSLQDQMGRIGGGATFSSKALQAITAAMTKLAKAIGYMGFATLQAGFSVQFTVFDVLAELLTKAVALGNKMKDIAVGIVNAMMSFLGRVKTQVQDSTVSFLRYVLATFVSELGNRALQAMRRALQGGRMS